ncbi:helix-turn-helix domain-containing protein [Desulfitobacterium hafniense]|nr:AraC family transcriptional regulator [Desulfitobacterium hafniense]
MTVKEAGEKWGLGSRIVTLYCAEGKINGAVKKGNLWLIPEDAVKPEDRRRKKASIKEETGSAVSQDIYDLYEQSKHQDSWPFESLYENKELFAQIIKHFPYPLHICAPDGTMLFANEAFFEFVKSPTRELIKGNNIRNNPNLDRWGVKDFVRRSYQGEIVHAYDLRVPLQELIEKYSGNAELLSESLYHNMTAFPIRDAHHKIAYIVTVFTTSRYYQGRDEVIRGKEYIDEHWKEEFDIDKLSGIVHMSRYHYTRLFKQHTGITPYTYYQDVKISKLKEKLCDINLSITQVFDECCVDYNGNISKKFKQKIGMTPSQYRAMMTQK